jgi:hypothetical protein
MDEVKLAPCGFKVMRRCPLKRVRSTSVLDALVRFL